MSQTLKYAHELYKLTKGQCCKYKWLKLASFFVSALTQRHSKKSQLLHCNEISLLRWSRNLITMPWGSLPLYVFYRHSTGRRPPKADPEHDTGTHEISHLACDTGFHRGQLNDVSGSATLLSLLPPEPATRYAAKNWWLEKLELVDWAFIFSTV